MHAQHTQERFLVGSSRLSMWVVTAALAMPATHVSATVAMSVEIPITDVLGAPLYDPSVPFNNLWLGAGYNTPAYQALYAGYSPGPNAFVDSSVLATQANTPYGTYTFALKGAGTYKFSVIQPGTVPYQAGTSYDLTAALYVQPGATNPFNVATPQTNLVAFSDDDNTTQRNNPFPLYYINNDATGCVTLTLVVYGWSRATNAVAAADLSGPGIAAGTCAEVDQLIMEQTRAVPALSAPALAGMAALMLGCAAWVRRRRASGPRP